MTATTGSGDVSADLSARLVSVRRAVESRIPAYASVLHVPVEELVPGRPLRFTHSVILPFGASDNGGAGFVIKLYGGPQPAEAASTEYHNLKILHPAFAARNGPLRVPHPLDYLAEFPAVVMERLPGERLDRIIAREQRLLGRRGARGSALMCERCGAWLRSLLALADAPRLLTGGLSPDFQEHWGIELSRMLAAARARGLAASLLSELEELYRVPPASDQPVTRLHNDFAPYNVHGDPGTVYVIDFAEMPCGTGEQAAAFFWAALELLKLHPTLSARGIRYCQRAFLEGYGGELAPIWEVWGMLRQLSYLPRAVPGDPPHLRVWKRYRRQRVTRGLRRALREL